MLNWFKKKPAQPASPDFSDIDSPDKARALFHRGDLEKLHLMPLEYGGEDHPMNTLYVPVGVAAIKSNIDLNIIGQLIEDGAVSSYEASPEYQGASVIPIAVTIKASDPGSFTTTINIWGEALTRDGDD